MKIICSLLFIALINSSDCTAQWQYDSLFYSFDSNEILSLIKKKESINAPASSILKELSFKVPILNPIANNSISSKFGIRKHPVSGSYKYHKGLDIRGDIGTTVYGAADGYISETGYDRALGKFIKIKHSLKFETIYGHLDEILVETNQTIFQGEKIGFTGQTGNTTGPHLHFMILFQGKPINPFPFIF